MKKLSQWPWKNIGLVVLLLVILGQLFGESLTNTSFQAFNQDDSYRGFDGGNKVDMEVAPMMLSYSSSKVAAGSSIMPDPRPPENPIASESTERYLIRTGHLSLIVASVEEALETIKKKTTEWNGIVSESNRDNHDEKSQSGWIRIRIPADLFETAMTSLKEMALKVESENTQIDDVTGQIVDNEARLKTLKAKENQYLSILERAKTIEEILQATNYLENVRSEIEWAERSLKTTNEQVALSTIVINLIDEGDVEIFGVYWTPLLNIKKSARGALENITETVDTLMILILNTPLILLWILIIGGLSLLGWKGLKKTGLM